MKKMLKIKFFCFILLSRCSFIGGFVEKVGLIKVFIFVRILLKLRRCDETKFTHFYVYVKKRASLGVKLWDIGVIE
ncbi:hypothetical protein [Bacillus cereus]|uniref:hypothetical protein n=1 Tax=Bacillus cereus TaxID=1396 RepID=UPI00197ADCAC|nr:hypothetical protein [Bacillus cereus]